MLGRCSSAMSDMSRKNHAFCWGFFFSGYWWLWHLEIQLWAAGFVEKISDLTPLIILISKQSYEQKTIRTNSANPFLNPTDSRINIPSCTMAEVSEMFWLAYKPRAFRICGEDTLATYQLKDLNFCLMMMENCSTGEFCYVNRFCW